ncbi:putative restriction /modification enzyme [Myxococcus hansupus]|uniref:site-specific DNA-methyltransferase (adenine-specific) n=1 Tax=Pseudomyxococcus hansupus TaxID=1297742 RepID=A0A0H4X2U9_9BACT|nr:N-6 DNA methylase [Myxococcus hansupus]AKQ68203.1 putative restriction /modification enzyme [Myxococcus hansupus]
MARRLSTTRAAELAFNAISIEGGLLAADWLSRAAQLKAPLQDPADYGVPKGIELRDEIGRSWRIAQAHWADFEAGRKAKAEPDALSRRFTLSLLREALGYGDLAEQQQSLELDGRGWPLTSIDGTGRVPLVCAPAGSGLDTPHRCLGDEHRKRSAFGLIQEFLNFSKDALWGLASDGLTLRIVRDNASLTRPAWIEIDLARIFTERLYPDFAAAWLVLHRSRFGRADRDPASCALEAWHSSARSEGTRARERLRGGFEDAILALGQGFLSHPSNQALRKALHDGSLTKKAYFGELLRLVYRLIFLLAIEERELLHPKNATNDAKARYALGYSMKRLRDRSSRRAAQDRHGDFWEALKVVFRGLSNGEAALGLPALGGLFAPTQCPNLDGASLDNRALLGAVFKLCWLRESSGLSRVNWRDMGADELGYVYEGLLELDPHITQDGRTFSLVDHRGNDRKTSGSYYTPESLVSVLLDSALEPVIADTIAKHPTSTAKALLDLAIVDPACGSGHFLLVAARRLATHVARVSASGTPSAEEYQRALRQVVAKCIFGVDLNPMAIELCKVSLWMEAVDPGLPLTFLDSHIQHGNALIGTTPALMANGVPDAAWDPIEGDDKKTASALRKKNKVEAKQSTLNLSSRAVDEAKAVTQAVADLDAESDTDAASLKGKEQHWTGILSSDAYRHQKLVADAWCSAFVWPKHPGPFAEAAPTNGVWHRLRDVGTASQTTTTTTSELAEQYRFFHWHLQFPQVFAKGGFDVVLGNPPWERVKLQEQEFFAPRDEEIANAPNASARKKLIARLPATNPALWEEWTTASRRAEGESHTIRQSGRYPLCGKGDVNTYAIFAEHNRSVLGPCGRAGFIVPTGIATDDTTKEYFGTLVTGRELATFYSFENEEFVFPGVHHAFRFALLTVTRAQTKAAADLVFFARQVTALDDPERHFSLTPADFEALNPNTRTCPTFRSRRDADINLAMYRRVGVLWREDDPDGNPWGVRFMAMLHMANDSGLFRTRTELEAAGWKLDGNCFVLNPQRALPLIEAKMVHHFDHRYGTYEGQSEAQANQGKLPEFDDAAHADPNRLTLPNYWVPSSDVRDRLAERWSRGWLLGWRNICRSTDQRTVLMSLFPAVGVAHSMHLMTASRPPLELAVLYATLVSFVVDYAARQKVGGTNLTHGYMRQFPVPSPDFFLRNAPWDWMPIRDWITPRVIELTYTAWDLEPFALDVGDGGPPYVWDPERRFLLRAELDAAFFHLYGLSRDDVDYIMGTFPVVKKNDEKAYGEFRTKRVVLERYDALAASAASGKPYVSPLGPPRRA